MAATWLTGQGLAVEALTHLARASAWAEVAGTVVDGLLVGRLVVEGADGPIASLAARVPEDLPGAPARVGSGSGVGRLLNRAFRSGAATATIRRVARSLARHL